MSVVERFNRIEFPQILYAFNKQYKFNFVLKFRAIKIYFF